MGNRSLGAVREGFTASGECTRSGQPPSNRRYPGVTRIQTCEGGGKLAGLLRQPAAHAARLACHFAFTTAAVSFALAFSFSSRSRRYHGEFQA